MSLSKSGAVNNSYAPVCPTSVKSYNVVKPKCIVNCHWPGSCCWTRFGWVNYSVECVTQRFHGIYIPAVCCPIDQIHRGKVVSKSYK